jgi:hypothetical protein
MTLAEAVAEFERGRVVVEGLPSARSQTGEPYEVICAGALSPQREGGPAELGLYTSEELAAHWWLESIKLYAANKIGTVYWRIRPSLEEYPISEGDARCMAFRVYSRLLISDKPPIAAAA